MQWHDELMAEQQQWTGSSPSDLRQMVSAVSGPWLHRVLLDAGMEQAKVDQLLGDFHHGFPFVGLMPPCEVSETVRPEAKVPVGSASQTLLEGAAENNQKILDTLRESEYASDVWEQTVSDSQDGWMSYPEVVTSTPADKVLTRRLAVREQRKSGWRTRVVDHATESEINENTVTGEAPQHDSLDVLIWIVFAFIVAGKPGGMFKADVSKAFRRVPVAAHHMALSWVVFLFQGVPFMSQHRGMPFGTISAVMAWHRVGGAILFVIRRKLKLPMARYVDDYFGKNRLGLKFHGSRCLELFGKLLGIPCDESKSEWDKLAMDVLGSEVVANFQEQWVSTCLQREKAG